MSASELPEAQAVLRTLAAHWWEPLWTAFESEDSERSQITIHKRERGGREVEGWWEGGGAYT